MNQDIKFISLDITLEDWLIEKLRENPPQCESTGDLREGLTSLREGRSRSLVLGRKEEGATGIFAASGEVFGTAQGIGESSSTQGNVGMQGGLTGPGNICVGDLQISLKSRRVVVSGREVSLTPKEFDILYFLAENRGEVFTKEQIYKAVWSDAYLLDDSNIMAFIRKLRKKIEPDPDAPKYILTIWGIGYKFNDRL